MPKTKAATPAGKQEKPIGAVTHYYGGIGVAIIKFNKEVQAGTAVQFRGSTTSFTQTLDSMQFDHKDVKSAPKAKEIGIKVNEKVREGDKVFLVG